MRITNKIMQNNSLSNINTNKIMQDKLNTMMATEKKINRPSDDPVVAIRALRLRSNVTEVIQYYKKNIPDANSWLELTEDALKDVNGVITDMIKQCTDGASGDLKPEDRLIILEQLKALRDKVYDTGNADCAGRFIFTGLRTDTALTFTGNTTKDYTITEQLDKSAVDTITYVKTTSASGDDLTDLVPGNYAGVDVTENDVTATDIYRIRLAYDECSADEIPELTWTQAVPQPDGSNLNQQVSFGTATVVHSYDNPYEQVGDDSIVFVPETGELLLGKNVKDAIMSKKDVAATSDINEGEIRVTYHKSEWKKDDLRPEHYFACSAAEDGNTINYNAAYLDYGTEKQVIEYDVGFNQKIRVNTTGDECFNHGVKREVDDLVKAMQDVVDIEKIATQLETELKNASATDKPAIEEKLKAVNKAYTFMKDKAQKMFEHGITEMQGYLNEVNLAITNCGTRSKKLELTEERLMYQKTTFETLKSENEDADITEVTIQLGSAELTYEAALLATGKIMKSTLLDFI